MTTTTAGPIRWVDLPGTGNVRDLGGLPTASSVTRPGLLYRGDAPDAITPSGLAALTDGLGVRTVIDLRGPEEWPSPPPTWWAQGRPARVSSPMPFGATSWAGDDDERALLRSAVGGVDAAGYAAARVVGLLADPHARPVLVHCAAGKDRTALVTALLLAAGEVRPEAIVHDYVLSEERMPAVVARLVATGRYPAAAGASCRALMAPAAVMWGVLDHLDVHGGAVAHLLACGADGSAMEGWHRSLVV